jgi:hypothetical protein
MKSCASLIAAFLVVILLCGADAPQGKGKHVNELWGEWEVSDMYFKGRD